MTQKAEQHLYGVILAGGSGTRLWPLSTSELPKQFLSLGQGGSLIRQTLIRLLKVLPKENCWIVCGKRHAAQIQKQLPEIPNNQILQEPQAKNTLGAIALAAFTLKVKDPHAVMAVLPADHWIPIQDWDKFKKDLLFAVNAAHNHKALVTLGIKPEYPSTGFGYLERGESLDSGEEKCFALKAFHEKPDLNTAKKYLEMGAYFWNSGMFIWQVDCFLRELEQCQPVTFGYFKRLSESIGTAEYPDLLVETFENIKNISVDFGLMEKAKKIAMVPASFSWDDIGSLSALEKVIPIDDNHNSTQGECISIDSKKNIVISKTKPIALLGIEDLIVIEASNAVLVLPKDRAEDVKKIVEQLKEGCREDLL